jgi:hypothetical protein
VVAVQAHSGWPVTAIEPLPPSGTMLGGAANVSWHLGGVGPVVTVDVVAESHAAATSATATAHDTSNDGCLQTPGPGVMPHRDPAFDRIKASPHNEARFGFVHTVRQPVVEVFLSVEAACSPVLRDGAWQFLQNARHGRAPSTAVVLRFIPWRFGSPLWMSGQAT